MCIIMCSMGQEMIGLAESDIQRFSDYQNQFLFVLF